MNRRKRLAAARSRRDGHTPRRRSVEGSSPKQHGRLAHLGDSGPRADSRKADATTVADAPHSKGLGHGIGHANGDRADSSGLNVGPPDVAAVGARPVQAAFRRTATGISLSLDGLTIHADHATCNQYGTRALVTVEWGSQPCHRQRMNLDDPHQRELFIRKLKLSCQQAGMTDGTAPLSIIASRVSAGLLIQLGEQCRRRIEKPPADPHVERARRRVLNRRARKLLHSRAILSRVGTVMRANGYAGKLEPALLAYVALTSRLLQEGPISLAFVGDPATGKNATIDAALALVPPDGVYKFTASSPTAVVYTDEDFRHRTVVFKEADSIPDRGPAAAAIRALAEDNVLRYEVTIRGPRTGGLETWRIEKAGPTGLITTSTRPLAPQLHTRLLPVRVVNSDDRLTTFQVIRAKGDRATGRLPPPDLEPFLALQRWLAAVGERRVTVPFGQALARAMGDCSLELRTRRDFEALLACVRTIAFLHQQQRQRVAPGGQIQAAIGDYRLARDLLIGSFTAAAAEGLSGALRGLVAKIRDKEEITRAELGERVVRPRSTLYYQVAQALELELLSEEKREGKRLLSRNGALPDERLPLPDAEEVEGYFLGVPAPGWTPSFSEFISEFSQMGPQGVTAAAWAARKGQPVDVVRQRLDVLARGGTLICDPQSERYAVNSPP